VYEALKLFSQGVEVVASGDSVSEGEESSDLSERSGYFGISVPSDDGVVPLNRDASVVRGFFEVFVVFWEIGSPLDDVIAQVPPLGNTRMGRRCDGQRLVVYPKGQELAVDRG
jgi:hypothetical protein